jgi:hypothetical protein
MTRGRGAELSARSSDRRFGEPADAAPEAGECVSLQQASAGPNGR